MLVIPTKANRCIGKPSKAPTSNCNICCGPHRVVNCPKRRKRFDHETEESDSHGPSRVSQSLKLVNTIMVQSTMATKGLVYFRAIVNGKEVSVVADIGATYKFLDHGGLIKTSDGREPQ